jgi:beta-carotene hydroxylase
VTSIDLPRRAVPTAARTGLLRYRADLWSLAVVGAVLAGQLALFFLVERLWLAALGVLALYPLQSVTVACCHNHHHKPVFTVDGLNRLYEVALFLMTGMPPYLLTLHHNLGHHHHYLTPSRDTLRWLRRDGERMGYAEYLVINFLDVYPHTVALGRRHPAVFRKFLRYLVPSLALLALLLWLDPPRSLVVFVLPMAGQVLNTVRIGWQHHAGLDTESHLSASRNEAGRWYNLLTFNSGYHTAHHVKPGLHWSELPRLHSEIRDRIPPALING